MKAKLRLVKPFGQDSGGGLSIDMNKIDVSQIVPQDIAASVSEVLTDAASVAQQIASPGSQPPSANAAEAERKRRNFKIAAGVAVIYLLFFAD
jgi:hypothetical protein